MNYTILALISDVDHTLLTKAKLLTQGTINAVEQLRANNIAFGLVSGRPLAGLKQFTRQLSITAPVVAFNGGLLAAPDMKVIQRHPIRPEIARRAHEIFTSHGADVWVFTERDWLLRDPDRPHVAHEKKTIGLAPKVVAQLDEAFDFTFKIVGVSDDVKILERCEAEAIATIGYAATISSSPPYHIDITDAQANKGIALQAISALLKIPVSRVAAIGDGASDIPMFEHAGLSIAMGNAAPNVKAKADKTTASSEEEGFAQAVEEFIVQNSNRLQ